MNPDTALLAEQVRQAYEDRKPLRIRGGSTKDFLGHASPGEALDLGTYRGIRNYQPKELVLTCRAGTTLDELEAVLEAQGQMLPFEPPHFGPRSTLGGTIACGLSGPARPYWGAARDAVLGVQLLNGRGQVLRFGGEVMKNVAGYDVARLMVGALGTLGVLLEVSLRLMPRPAHTQTLVQERTASEALTAMNRWAGKPLPMSATCWDGAQLFIRLSGTPGAVRRAAQEIGGEPLAPEAAVQFWQTKIRDQQHGFFLGSDPLWRLSLPQAAPPLSLPGEQLVEWGGAQRWLRSDQSPDSIRQAVETQGGHATLFRGAEIPSRFHPLPPSLKQVHRRLKAAFDPRGILNPGRLYPDF